MIYEENYRVYKDGRIWSIRQNKFMNLTTHPRGYKRININGKGKLVHRMVAECFIPNPENKPQVNHKNGVKDDNRVQNLEWVTNSENALHAYRVLGNTHGFKKGVSPSNAKFSKQQIKDIRNSNLSYRKLALRYGVHPYTIERIIKKQTYKNV